jgi:hypothetical protein
MIELKDDALVFSFPEVHPDAVMTVEFQRTLRIPDDDSDYPLPPGLGRFPLHHVDDFAERVPDEWLRRGGAMLPMYPSEAMWLNFSSPRGYPFALKVATGKINAVTGAEWTDTLSRSPQDYLSIPEQPWLDGYCVGKGIVRQFVAMPLGSGYSVEEQLTGAARTGGLQLMVHPLRRAAYTRTRHVVASEMAMYSIAPAMGLSAGGRMRQEIYDDPHRFADWDRQHRSRCFIHAVNALVWRAVTDEEPPSTPATAAAYTRAGLPWFEYYAPELDALGGGGRLKGVRSVAELGEEKGQVPLPENESVAPGNVVRLRRGLGRDEVREGAF